MTAPAAPRVVDWPAALRELRRRRGWSQARLAAEIGATEHTVWRYEVGRSHPTGAYRKQLQALIDAERSAEVAPAR